MIQESLPESTALSALGGLQSELNGEDKKMHCRSCGAGMSGWVFGESKCLGKNKNQTTNSPNPEMSAKVSTEGAAELAVGSVVISLPHLLKLATRNGSSWMVGAVHMISVRHLIHKDMNLSAVDLLMNELVGDLLLGELEKK